MWTGRRIVLAVVAILVFLGGASWAEGAVFRPVTGPAYAPGEIIVKFRQRVADALEQQLAEGRSVPELELSGSLDRLNGRYNVNNVEALVKNFKAGRQRIENLLEKDPAFLTPRERHLVRRLRRAPGGAVVPDLGRIYKLEFEGAGDSVLPLHEVLDAYNGDPDVEYAELNCIVSICLTEPNDPNYWPEQWALHNDGNDYPIPGGGTEWGTAGCDVNAPEAWDIQTGSSDIIVAVVDTGVDYTHRDLQNNMWADENGLYGFDFSNGDGDPMDDHGHGTHCAGTIAADANNGLDIAGISWNAKIMALKLFDSHGGGDVSDAIPAFAYATDNGADVISNSWGGGPDSNSLRSAIDYAYSQGVIIVAAAGNSNSDDPDFYPANYDHVISVAATDSNDDRASFSNYGDWVDIAAPGVHILSLHAHDTDMYKDGQHFYPHGDEDAAMYICSGTSMGCPHVGGACALLLSVNGYMSPDDANNILMASADELDDPNICRSGRLNVHKALLAAVPSKGYVSLDRDYYNCNCNILISLADSDLKGEGAQDVNIAASGGDSNTVALYETGSNTGIFTGTISTGSGDPNVGDGILQVSNGETITVTYDDASDGTATDTATVDCLVPSIISDVNVVVLGPDVTVRFDTDEYTLGRVLYDVNCGGDYNNSARGLGTEHSIKLKVSPWTDYHFIVEAEDAAGNKTTDTNDANCYTFTTEGPNDLYVPEDYNSIQDAIDHSWDGGTVIVAEGTYYECINFKGKAVTVTGTKPDNWETVEATVIDANMQYATVVFFRSGENRDSVLRGLTIRNSVGQGVLCSRPGGPVVSNCIVENCADYGLVSLNLTVPVFSNNKVRNNERGILLAKAPAYVENNWVHDNNDLGIRVVLGGGKLRIAR